MKYRIGDKVLFSCKSYRTHCTVVESCLSRNNIPFNINTHERYLVRKKGHYNIGGSEVTTWVSGVDLELDKQWYRDKLLKQILDV